MGKVQEVKNKHTQACLDNKKLLENPYICTCGLNVAEVKRIVKKLEKYAKRLDRS